jgi:hypothetical protein
MEDREYGVLGLLDAPSDGRSRVLEELEVLDKGRPWRLSQKALFSDNLAQRRYRSWGKRGCLHELHNYLFGVSSPLGR